MGFMTRPMVKSAAASEPINTLEATCRAGVLTMAIRTRKFPQTVTKPEVPFKIRRTTVDAVENSFEQVEFSIFA